MKRFFCLLIALSCVAGIRAETGHEILLGSAGDKMVYRISRQGEIVWSAPAPAARDLWQLANGDLLYKAGNTVLIVDETGTKKWHYTGVPKSQLHACQPLDNGNILIAECGPCRIIEVDPAGKIAKEIPVPTSSNTHMQMRGTRKTKDGTYITSISGEQDVIEIDDTGKILRHYKPNGINYDHVHSVTCLENGHVLIGTGKGGRFIEVDRNNQIVWQVCAADLNHQAGFDAFKIDYAAGTQRLANGNTLCAVHAGSVALFEVTPEKKIVWTLPHREGISGAICVMALDDAEKGHPLQK